MSSSFVQIETRAGDPVSVGDTEIVPLARSLCIQPPGFPAGLIWNRPSAVIVRTADGQERMLPVPDVTRQKQLRLLGIGLIGSLLIWLVLRRSRGG